MKLERSAACGELRGNDAGREVVLAGWVARRRDHGNLIFIDIRDRSGICQVVFRPDTAPEAHGTASGIRGEFVVAVRGTVAAREGGNVNPNLLTGDIELVATDVEILNESEPVPFPVEDPPSASEETRLRWRYIDLRRPGLQAALDLRHRLMLEARRVLDARGFVEIETPILTRSTPEGARDYLVPSRVHRGDFYALPQSPQLFKQILMVAGFEKYFQFARCFRDEDLRADRQPEFTQIDLEMSFVSRDGVMEVVEDVIVALGAVGGVEVARPIRRMSWDESMRRFGSDRPDLRFDVEISDVSAQTGSGFPPFDEALGSGGAVQALVAPILASYSRKKLDELTAMAKEAGARTLVWIKRQAEGCASPAAKTLGDEGCLRISDAAGAKENDLVLIVPGEARLGQKVLGILRLALARRESWIPKDAHAFLWVTDFPLFDWSAEDERWAACHHPFTSPLPEDLDRLESDPGTVRSAAYDLVLDGTEIAGGSIRIHRQELQERVFRILGMTDEEATRRFGFFLRALRMGAPPHGGIAFGFDRIVALFCGVESIRDVIAFPKTTSASCLMTESPSPVDARQLKELGLREAE